MRKNNKFIMIKYISKYKLHILLVIIFAIISSLTSLLGPFVVGKAIDYTIGINNVNFQLLAKTLIILLIVYFVNAISTWFMMTFSIKITNEAVKSMREDAFDKILSLPLSYIDSTKTGDLLSKFSNDIDSIYEGVLQCITQFFPGIITIIASLILMLSLSLWITFTVIIITPMAILIANFIAKSSGKMFKLQQQTLGEYNGYVEEAITNYNVIRAFSYENQIQDITSEVNLKLYNYGQKAQFYSSLVNPSTRFVNNISYVLVAFIGGLSGIAGGLTIGNISSLLSYSTQFTKPLNEMSGILTQIQSSLAASERFSELMNEPSEISDKYNEKLQGDKFNIKFENVYFSYNKNEPLIKNLNIDIKQGSMVAIVGPTGAGKTTIINLLMRFYDLDSGRIIINEQNINNVTRNSLRLSFGMVLQDTWLFRGTIAENIGYGKKESKMKDIIEVSKIAKAHNFIKKLENGYYTIIAEDGNNLSQGQKQLITIARAMLSNPPMLILDEATSNIDPRTEQIIQSALQKLMENKTSFVIAHRLSTIENADIILVMDKGNIIEHGNHNELMYRKGFYYELHKKGIGTE